MIQQDNDQEWFSFAVGGGGLSTGPDDSVGITFDPTEGQLSLTLLNSSGKTIGTSSAVGGTEEITLPPTSAATSYYVLVTGAANPDYTLSVTGPGTTATDQAIVPGERREQQLVVVVCLRPRHAQRRADAGPVVAVDRRRKRVVQVQDVAAPRGEHDSTDFVGILFDDTLGDLNVQLFNSSLAPIGQSGDSCRATSSKFRSPVKVAARTTWKSPGLAARPTRNLT